MLNENFRDILAELNAAEAEYLLIGAYALSVHGFDRLTGDIDIWVRASEENADKVWKALQAFRAPTHHASRDDFAKPDIVFFMGKPPSRIDILTSISGVEFDAAWPNRQIAELSGLEVPVISRGDLLANKLASGRPKDLIDANWLQGEQ